VSNKCSVTQLLLTMAGGAVVGTDFFRSFSWIFPVVMMF
jgi:hypothetical protein